MTEAWNAEQRKAAGIGPDLFNPHEEDERCGGDTELVPGPDLAPGLHR